VARASGLPLCQDTGTPVFFVRAGVESPWLADLPGALVDAVRVAPRACPPVIVGVGIGGTADLALRLAKRALIRPLDARHDDPAVAAFEVELLDAVNRSGIGPMGLGGACTALAVHADFAYRHPASLPVGVALQCWADRRGTVRIPASGIAEVVE